MYAFVVLCVFLSVATTITNGFLEAKYLKTNVYQDTYRCTIRVLTNYIEKNSAISLIMCGLKCIWNPNCRRFLYDQMEKDCLLYESGEQCYSVATSNKLCYRQKNVCNATGCERCAVGYYGNQCENIIQDCSDGMQKNVLSNNPQSRSFLFVFIQPNENGSVIEVECHAYSSGYTYIANRLVRCKDEDFNRTWDDYSTGFGLIHSNYWLGLQNVYDILQNHGSFKLKVRATINDKTYTCVYEYFRIANEVNNFTITVEDYLSKSNLVLGNSLLAQTNISGRPFSTIDRDHTSNGCPMRGGWWYADTDACSDSSVTGKNTELKWFDDGNNLVEVESIQLRIIRN